MGSLPLGFAAYGCSFYLFVTWLPGYLVKDVPLEHHERGGSRGDPVERGDDHGSGSRRLAQMSIT